MPAVCADFLGPEIGTGWDTVVLSAHYDNSLGQSYPYWGIPIISCNKLFSHPICCTLYKSSCAQKKDVTKV